MKAENPTAATCMGSLTIGNDSEWPAIQVADLVAGLCKDHFVLSFRGLIKDETVAIDKLRSEIGNHISLSYIDAVALRKIVEGNLLRKGKPSIRSTKQAKLFKDLFKV